MPKYILNFYMLYPELFYTLTEEVNIGSTKDHTRVFLYIFLIILLTQEYSYLGGNAGVKIFYLGSNNSAALGI